MRYSSFPFQTVYVHERFHGCQNMKLKKKDIIFSKTARKGLRLMQIADSLSSDGNLRSSILWLASAEKRAATVIPSPCTGYSAASDSTSKDQSSIKYSK